MRREFARLTEATGRCLEAGALPDTVKTDL